MLTLLALALTIVGSACLYLASPNQRWLSRMPPARPLLVLGTVLLLIGLALWIAALRPLSGVAVALHVVMVCLFALPYAAALRGTRRRRHG
ncbi:hypothetical protein [Pseudorhodoferax sp.]|uniref:hypothetical protein n=1 Tax=Pseudorhodoferax sp. TaxID=1993553 RepID=UPI0039E344EC